MMQMWTGSLGMIKPSFDKVLDGLSLLVFVLEWDQSPPCSTNDDYGKRNSARPFSCDI